MNGIGTSVAFQFQVTSSRDIDLGVVQPPTLKSNDPDPRGGEITGLVCLPHLVTGDEVVE